jgi:hypothetical protein
VFGSVRKFIDSVLLWPAHKSLNAGQKLRRFGVQWCGLMRWVLQSSQQGSRRGARRVLAIYDLTSQPFSIGDILLIQEASLVVRARQQLEWVDFALVYDPQPATCVDPAFRFITSENLLFHVASVLPAAQFNPYHGSLFVFNSHEQLNRFIAAHSGEYCIWPSARKFAGRKYNSLHVFNELLCGYHCETGAIPELSSRRCMLQWAAAFCERHVGTDVMVTMQVRRNKNSAPGRNLQLDCWLDFFRHCEPRYPVKFVIVCALSEVDPRLRQHPNVLIAKDLGTTLEQDLTLIQTAAMHMGASSGPGTIAQFNRKPYLIVNSDVHLAGYEGLIADAGFWRFPFATPLQRFAPPPTTLDLLVTEFARMWASIALPACEPGASPRPGPAAA